MELDRNCWYVRLFFWSLEIVDEFTDGNRVYDAEKEGTNLCPFMRTILICMPLIFLLHAVVIAAAVYALTALPIRLFGGWAYVWAIIGIACVLLMILVIKFTLKALAKRALSRQDSQQQEEEKEEPERPSRVAVEKETSGPSFSAVLREYIVAIHKKVCPMIVFKQSKEA